MYISARTLWIRSPHHTQTLYCPLLLPLPPSLLLPANTHILTCPFSFTACLPLPTPPGSQVAAQDDGKAKAIVEAAAPFRAIFCSPEFESLYGLSEPMVLGRSLNLIHGPNTDMRGWNRQMKMAQSGVASSNAYVTSTSQCCEVETIIDVQPIVSDQGFVSHLLVAFRSRVPFCNPLHDRQVDPEEYVLHSNATPQNFNDWDLPCALPPAGGMTHHESYASQSEIPRHVRQMDVAQAAAYVANSQNTSHVKHLQVEQQDMHAQNQNHQPPARYSHLRSLPAHMPAMPPTFEHIDFDSAYGMPHRNTYTDHTQRNTYNNHTHASDGDVCLGSSAPSAIQRCKMVSRVMPRRKAGQDAKFIVAPVSITLETLETYASVPISKAATSLGISSTAMKKACRKLGVTRWPYNSPSLSSTAAAASNPNVTHVDSAYVRKLFRKYSGAVRITDFKLESAEHSASGGAVTVKVTVKAQAVDSQCATSGESCSEMDDFGTPLDQPTPSSDEIEYF